LVASAAIQAKNVDTGAIHPTESTATGNYTLSELRAGNYELTATVQPQILNLALNTRLPN
jgi:hypothetical protein